MSGRWKEFLHGTEPCGHGVQIYADAEELGASVAEYLAAGFDTGCPAVLVATPDHARRVRAALAARGWSERRLEAAALLRVEDAEATLDRILDERRPSPAAFESVVGGLIDAASERFPDADVRVFGEMVDLLCRRGERAAAAELEELWNRLGRSRRFSLLCGYRLDVFDRASQTGVLPEVCRAHSHVLPAADTGRLAHAVDLALEDVLGPAEAGKVYALVGAQIREARVPAPQLVLMWVSENMPALADRVLASARARYAAPA